MITTERTINSRSELPAVTYENVELDDVVAIATFGEEKIRIRGKLSLNFPKNSVKFDPNEIQIQVFSDSFSRLRRSTRGENKWNRIEIFLKKDQLTKIFMKLIDRGKI